MSNRLTWLRAAAIALIPLAPAQLQAQDDAQLVQAGVSAAVRGDVQLTRLARDLVGVDLDDGREIFLQDEISAGAGSGLQVLLLDETVFTIGPQSDVTIDRFVYDPQSGTGELAAEVTQGVFRFVSGKIAEANPSDMEVDVPQGTIGVRGTIVAGRAGEDETLIVLLGPGHENNTRNRVGAIEVSTPWGNVTISRANFATILRPGQPPTTPFRLEPSRIEGLIQDLTVNAGAGDVRGELRRWRPPVDRDPSEWAGEGRVLSLTGSSIAEAIGDDEDEGRMKQQDVIDGVLTSQEGATEIADGLTSLAELTSITMGTGVFSQNGVVLTPTFGSGNPGSYDMTVTVDFGAETVSFDYVLDVFGPDSVQRTGIPFTDLFVNGVWDSFQSGNDNPLIDDSLVTIRHRLRNANGRIADELDHDVRYSPDGTYTGGGTATRQ